MRIKNHLILIIGTLLVIPVLVLIIYGCIIHRNEKLIKSKELEEENKIKTLTVEKEPVSEEPISDNMSLYTDYKEDDSVIKMYLTVSSGNEADSSNHTWTEVNSYSAYYYNDLGIDRYKVEGILQIDEGEGINKDSFGYGVKVPNASVQIRGQTSSKNQVKNYKIRIKDGQGEFRGQRTLNLNKHVGEYYRFVNKLCYDLLDDVPELIGGGTQFVNLFVKDTTEGGDNQYHDYGLYTMVEQVNKTYLRSRGLDTAGQLYKVSFFEWDKYDEIAIPYDSAEFDREAFEEYLEIKGNEDNTKINDVVNEVNNYMRPIDEIVEEHFDAENICYWMAFNILIGNYDSHARNLFLYSPLNSKKFYIICWDMDASMRKYLNEAIGRNDGLSWERGATEFLGLKLVNRMLKEEKYRKMLDDAIDDLYKNYATPSKVDNLVKKYSEVTMHFLYEGADQDNAKMDKDEYERLIPLLGKEITDNYNYYWESKAYPWPFFVALPENDIEGCRINWDISYDVKGESITYSYVLARDYYFKDIVAKGQGLVVPSAKIESLPPGIYYLRVTATNESGLTQDSFDYYSSLAGKIYGCLAFEVKADGTVEYVTTKL